MDFGPVDLRSFGNFALNDLSRIDGKAFVIDGEETYNIIFGACRIERIEQNEPVWASNMCVVNNFAGFQEQDASKGVVKEVLQLKQRLENSRLSSVVHFQQALSAKAKCYLGSNPSHEAILSDALCVSYSADFTVLVVEMYLQKKPSHPLQTFKVLATSKMAKVFDMLYCNSLVIRKLASITEELGTPPKSLEELKRLKETISGLEIPNQFWRMVRFDDKFFAEPLNHQFTRCLLEDRPVEPLETQCWLDLAVCPYTPYAYIHCNMCEHFLVIKQVRLAHPVLDADVLKSPEGVVEVAKHKARRKICRVCDYYFAEWILRDDKLLPENPCFLCQQCFESLHYTADGGLAYGDFEMFPYLGAD